MADTILLLRHGETSANRQGRWHGSTDTKLTWRGKRQAHRTARHLASIGISPAAIYSSPLQRCQFVAGAIGQSLNMDVQIDPALREYSIGEWENLPFKELARTHNFINRATDDHRFAPPGGESLSAVAERIVPAIQAIDATHPDAEFIIVVGHGAAMAVALAQLLHHNPAAWVEYHFHNCSLTALSLKPKPHIHYFNQSTHL